ncbi:TniB family NTP-binding protein, partial [Rhodobacteraceae bacterium]|nr:TniB family NTP-binding protein [Paracoccaceae bacterium]
TEALKKIRQNFSGLRIDAPDDRIGEFVSVETPSPATLKWTGIATLKALNFDIGGKPGAPEIWGLVRHHLAMHRVLFLHFDEAQDFILNQSGREANSVINTIKSLTQCERWPVSVVLSGNTVLADILDSDFQLGRRVPPVHFENLSSAGDTSDVADILQQYLSAADLGFDMESGIEEFISRLIAAASGQLGLVFEFILEAISLAFDAQRQQLHLSDFQQVYRDRTGSVDGANPFIAEDYHGINARAVLDGKLTKQTGPKKSWMVS